MSAINKVYCKFRNLILCKCGVRNRDNKKVNLSHSFQIQLIAKKKYKEVGQKVCQG